MVSVKHRFGEAMESLSDAVPFSSFEDMLSALRDNGYSDVADWFSTRPEALSALVTQTSSGQEVASE